MAVVVGLDAEHGEEAAVAERHRTQGGEFDHLDIGEQAGPPTGGSPLPGCFGPADGMALRVASAVLDKDGNSLTGTDERPGRIRWVNYF